MSFWTYILRCGDGHFYTGHSDNLPRRLSEHQQGECPGYTQLRRPLVLAWSQEFPSREEALAAERQIKRWSRRKKMALIDSDWDALRQAARKDFRKPLA